MKMKSKILGIVLVLVMVVSMLPSVGITYAAPNANATYTVDTSATLTQAAHDYHYEQAGATLTADGYNLTAASGDFDARIWVNGCYLGNQINNGGLTVSFTASLPQTNEGDVYYCYSAEQDNANSYPFVGFKPTNSGYRLLSNMEENSETFYNDTLYSGDVPVILYITPDEFELYVDGAYIATVDAESSLSLGERWFYGFQSYYAGNTETTLTVTNVKYLNGKAILADGEAVPTSAPATQAPVTQEPDVTEVPAATETPAVTEAPAATAAPVPIQATITASMTANGGSISNLTSSTTVAVASNATVTSGDDLDAILAIIVYDGAGKIVNIAYETLSIDADVSTSVTKALEAGFNLPSNIQGYKIRIAVYDNLVSLNQLASVSYTIE